MKKIIVLILCLFIFQVPQNGFCGKAGLQTATSSKIIVGSVSTEIFSADLFREFMSIVNDSDENIYVSFGGPAVLNEGIRLNAGGGSLTMLAPVIPHVVINAICLSGGKNVTISEGT